MHLSHFCCGKASKYREPMSSHCMALNLDYHKDSLPGKLLSLLKHINILTV